MLYAILGIIVIVLVALIAFAIWRVRTNVFVAIRTDSFAATCRLLDRHPEFLTTQDANGETPVHHAAKYGMTRILDELHRRGADVESRGRHEVTPLHLAAYFGETECARSLLSKGASADPKDADGVTPLQLAHLNGHFEIEKVLLDAGATPFPEDPAQLPKALVDSMSQQVESAGFLALSDADSAWQNAVAMARSTTGQLVEHFHQHPVIAKVLINVGHREHIWCSLLAIEGETLSVRLDSAPRFAGENIPRLQQCACSAIADWQVTQKDGTVWGCFTYRAYLEKARAESKPIPRQLAELEKHFAKPSHV